MATWPVSRPSLRTEIMYSMETRNVTLVLIGCIVLSMLVVAFGSLFVAEMNERAAALISNVFGTCAMVLTGLLVMLRVERVGKTADSAREEAKVGREVAAVAATEARALGQKLDRVHEDVLNGPMRENFIQAIKDVQTDPEIVAKRIDIVAKGVSKDRHDKRNREAADDLKEQRARRQRQREEDETDRTQALDNLS